MPSVELTCPTCAHRFSLRTHRKLRILAAGTGALVGGMMSDSILGAVLIGGVAYAATRAIDNYWARRCRVCGTIVDLPAKSESDAEVVEARSA